MMNGWAELEGKKGCDEGFGEQNDNEKKASGWREGERERRYQRKRSEIYFSVLVQTH